ncbi:KH domain-containing protein [Amycolatopsis sp. CA-230715]|uniref:KH domain-containing protein n=1 Tax=Amycolatopsis sp. CA-230715 TaxID=2745196 RepID=UPI001C027C64|nr:KH domain-containing protein [Amycolatopsis sp. CA-230715]
MPTAADGAGVTWARQERLPHSELSAARARDGHEDKGRWFAPSIVQPPLNKAIRARGSVAAKDNGVTDDSAFKKQIRARMAETGEKYTVARRRVLAGRDSGAPPGVLRVYLRSHVDLELTAEARLAYAAADERDRREMAGRLLADRIEVAGFPVTGSKIVTDQESRVEAEDATIRGAVRRAVDRAVGVSAVEIDHAGDRLWVGIRAVRPILLAGRRGEEADRLRGELEELTGGQVRLDIREVTVPGVTSTPG